MPLSDSLFILLEAAFNELIHERPDLFSPTLSKRCVGIDFSGLNFKLYFFFTQDQVAVLPFYEKLPDATITGTPMAFLRYVLKGYSVSAQELRIAGHLDIAQAFERLCKAVDLDWERYLSRYTGDVIAYRVTRVWSGLKQWQVRAVDSFNQDMRSYLQIEQRYLPLPSEVEQFNRGVDELHAAVERLELRIRRLPIRS